MFNINLNPLCFNINIFNLNMYVTPLKMYLIWNQAILREEEDKFYPHKLLSMITSKYKFMGKIYTKDNISRVKLRTLGPSWCVHSPVTLEILSKTS